MCLLFLTHVESGVKHLCSRFGHAGNLFFHAGTGQSVKADLELGQLVDLDDTAAKACPSQRGGSFGRYRLGEAQDLEQARLKVFITRRKGSSCDMLGINFFVVFMHRLVNAFDPLAERKLVVKVAVTRLIAPVRAYVKPRGIELIHYIAKNKCLLTIVIKNSQLGNDVITDLHKGKAINAINDIKGGIGRIRCLAAGVRFEEFGGNSGGGGKVHVVFSLLIGSLNR